MFEFQFNAIDMKNKTHKRLHKIKTDWFPFVVLVCPSPMYEKLMFSRRDGSTTHAYEP